MSMIKIGDLTVNLNRVNVRLQQDYRAASLAVQTSTAASKAAAMSKLAAIETAILAEQAATLTFKSTPAIRGTSNVANTLRKRG